MERAASATALPCAVSTSTWRSLATISSGVCVLFLPIDEPPSASASHITGGPLLGGQVTVDRAEVAHAGCCCAKNLLGKIGCKPVFRLLEPALHPALHLVVAL